MTQEYDNELEFPVEQESDQYNERTVYSVPKYTFKNKRKLKKIEENARKEP